MNTYISVNKKNIVRVNIFLQIEVLVTISSNSSIRPIDTKLNYITAEVVGSIRFVLPNQPEIEFNYLLNWLQTAYLVFVTIPVSIT